MNKEKFYKFMMIGLLCSNLLLLYFYLHKRPPHDEPKRIMAERLHFDAAQMVEQEALVKAHRQAMKKNQDAILALRNALYKNLIATSQPNAVDSLSSEIAALQKSMELVNFHHFEAIKKLCKPEQQANFDNLVEDLAVLFRHTKR